MTDFNTKRNLHILHDDKFTDGAIRQFERYYPHQNIYVVLLYAGSDLKDTPLNTPAQIFKIRDAELKNKIYHIIRTNNVENLFIHYLDNFKASITNKILERFSLKFYWIFYGGDLYGYLQQYRGYHILDDPGLLQKKNMLQRIIRELKYLLWFRKTIRHTMFKAFGQVDYFCFWNEYDFELYQSYFKNNAVFKPFIYYHALGNPAFSGKEKEDIILINHSASFSGNHLYIFRLLNRLGFSDTRYSLLIPLSYGNKEYADIVEDDAIRLFGEKAEILRDFMPIVQYQQKLSKVKVAIFGMKRQEAAGNIFQLLNMGAKVFLREENTVLKWLRNRDFVVFSVEKDLSDMHQITPLSEEEIIHNRACYHRYFSADMYNDMMKNLIGEG